MGKRDSKKRKRVKLTVTYDEAARKEYITGFEKRKKERRERAMAELEAKAKEEKSAHIKEMRESRQKVRNMEKPKETKGSRKEEEKKTNETNLKEIGGEKVAVNTEEYKVTGDKFSKSRFGSGVVTVTTTTIKPESDSEDEEDGPVSWGKFSGQKHVKIPTSDAARKLDRLRQKSKHTKKQVQKGRVRSKKKSRGTRTGAKERRRRK